LSPLENIMLLPNLWRIHFISYNIFHKKKKKNQNVRLIISRSVVETI